MKEAERLSWDSLGGRNDMIEVVSIRDFLKVMREAEFDMIYFVTEEAHEDISYLVTEALDIQTYDKESSYSQSLLGEQIVGRTIRGGLNVPQTFILKPKSFILWTADSNTIVKLDRGPFPF